MNRLFVSIWFPYLLPQWYFKKHPALQNKPLVITFAHGGRLLVKAADCLAKKTGYILVSAWPMQGHFVPGLIP